MESYGDRMCAADHRAANPALKILHLAMALWILLFCGCTCVTVSGSNTQANVTLMINGNTANVPVSGLPGLP